MATDASDYEPVADLDALREDEQTFGIAERLFRGETIHGDADD